MGEIVSPLAELQCLLPLLQRQQALPAALRHLHQRILQELYQHPRLLTVNDVELFVSGYHPQDALNHLARDDLIVLDDSHTCIVGAYPISLEATPFQLKLGDHWIYAMCALDALAVAPMFGAEVEIHSVCNISNTRVFIHQRGYNVLTSTPQATGKDSLQVGIHWQTAGHCAAHSLCRDIVFLRDVDTMLKWRQQIDDKTSNLGLREAIELGAEFFCPLLG